MKKNKLSLFKNVVKYTWRTSIFCYSTIFIHSSVNSLLNSYNDKEKCVYKHKRKNYFDFFATISLKTIPISYCSCQLAYNCDNNNVLPTETEYNNLELFKRLFFKLIQYEYFIIHKIISCINESIIFVLYSLANFYLYFHSAFFNICNLLSKIYHGQGNNGMLYTYPNIPYTIINSFVTIHKIYEHNRIPLKHDFKNDQLEYMGSGFIYDKRGHILTAAHNITNLEDKFVVKNSNGLYFATVLGLHKGSDVCVMKIDSKEPLSYISLDKIRDDLKQGEPVVTYGQIQNFDKETYSVGIVNHPKQTFTMFENFNENGQTTLYPFIQISNPINKGMSGSPLLDQHGNLVGMIQKKIDNYGLALPANILKNVAIHLQNNGVYKEPFLGIVFREKTFTIQNSRPLTKELKISSILANSPAALGSLKKEDIILKMNNKDIESICDVHEILNSANDGYINIDGVRNGKKFKTQVITKKKLYNKKKYMHTYIM
ncbi:trypsin-like serine protease, putative [Plasmodium vinckei vinckei]|uniref:Trypsin-like serine protease, putative n=1 Tax=Plasmodium vinckei vinckei TaxID=54757 RepID=A0A449BZY6_PLAVN|nr:trypsin-like serine protease, putative [Plasmodium vinckei vinckei]VEV59028.1 trypsin-like serine protease, putative [Plasmodium vinckei vinckei]